MKNIYRLTETIFEKFSTVATTILGNSITFIIALAMIIYFLTSKAFYEQETHHMIRDIIHSVTFITLFIIQKSFNKFAALLHLKVNELVASHEPASNAVIHAEGKTEHEITQLSKEYIIDLAEQKKEEEEVKI